MTELNLNGLPVEMRHLIHHVELHRSGWWDRALDRLVLVTLWQTPPLTAAELMLRLRQNVGNHVSQERVDTVLGQLRAAGTIVETGDDRLKVAEDVGHALTAELKAVTQSEERVKARLARLCESAGFTADSDQLWVDFEQLFMLPLVRESGARLYEVITASAVMEAAVPTYGQLLEPMCKKYGHEIRAVLVTFIDPTDTDVRAYVLRTLNAAFVREAAGLDSGVLDALQQSRGKPDRVRIFVDTNYLFSFLGLHDNPSNAAAADLIELIDRAKSWIKIELYVLPITVEEARRVLREVMFRLSGTMARPNLAAAAREFTSTGLVARYLSVAATHRGGTLKADDFFGPYESNLVTILRERGVELFNADLEALRVDQKVIDDIHDQEAHQKVYRKRGSKSYESNLHDMVLWHFVSRQRPAGGDSPLEVGSWVCTVDYGLIAFDRSRRRGNRRPPVCMTPSALLQLLQFWAPRTDELDRALVGAIREPLLFLDFDGLSEQATIRILRALSRFEGVEDLSTSTIYNVLANEALRGRLEAATAMRPEYDAELVEAAVVEEARRLEADLETLQKDRDLRVDAARREVEQRALEAEALQQLLEKRDADASALSAEVIELRRALDHERVEGTSRVESLASDHDRVVRRLSELEHGEARRKDVRRVAATLGATAGALAVVGYGCEIALTRSTSLATWVIWLGVGTAAVLSLLLVGEFAMRGKATFEHALMHRAVVLGRRAVLLILSGVLASLIAGGILNSQATNGHIPPNQGVPQGR